MMDTNSQSEIDKVPEIEAYAQWAESLSAEERIACQADDILYLMVKEERAKAFWKHETCKTCPTCGHKVVRPEKFSERTSEGDNN